MTVTVKIEGLSELKTAIEQLPKAVGKSVMRKVLLARAEPLADAAKAYCPVDTGELRDSIVASLKLTGSQRRDAKETQSYIEVYIGAKAFYAHMIEFGTVHNPPQPFMRPAWDAAKGSLLDGLKEDLWAEIEKAVAKTARKAARGAS